MISGDHPNAFWHSVRHRFEQNTALISLDGQKISFDQLDRAISNIADLLIDYGAKPDARIACSIPNFAVTVAFWFATWRIGGHVMTAPDPRQFVDVGLPPDFVIVPDGAISPVGKTVPLRANSLVDEPGAQVEAAPGKTYFHTANTPRERRAMAVGPQQIINDARLYSDLLRPPKRGVYMTTGLSSLRAMRDVLRAFGAGVHVVGGDVTPQAIWPRILDSSVGELMLSPLSLHKIMEFAPDTGPETPVDRVFVAAGTAQPDLLYLAHSFFGDVIELGAGTNETSVYAFKKYHPVTHVAGDIGHACCGIVGEIRSPAGDPTPFEQEGQLALWVPPAQRYEGYVNANSAYDDDGWVYPGFLARQSADGAITKLGRTDDRINLGGTRMFSGKIEAEVERLETVLEAVAVRVYAQSGVEALGVAVRPGPGFDAEKLREVLKRSLRGIGDIFVKTLPNVPKTPNGEPDRLAVERDWFETPAGR